MKSGTNWVSRLLNTHPDIECFGEFHWERLLRAHADNLERIAPRRRQKLDRVVRPEFARFVERCLTALATSEAALLGDRTPTTLEPIVLPDAPQIAIIRDFRDVIVSRMFHLYNHPRVTGIFDRFPAMNARLQEFRSDPWFFQQHPDQLLANEEVVRDSAREWSEHQRSDRMTINQNPQLRVRFIRYEDLHHDFDRQLGELFRFLGFDPPLEAPPEQLRPGHEAENPNQLNRKGQIGDWKNYMTDMARGWINDECGEELERQHYIESRAW